MAMAAGAAGAALELRAGAELGRGRYRVRRELNRGGTAVVYEAEDRGEPGAGGARGKRVALKVMNSAGPGSRSQSLAAVKREIGNAASLKHPNFVQLLDVFAEGPQRLVIVWELVTGPDLLDLLNACGGRMTEARAGKYLSQTAAAVEFLHENNLCHRDLKPENCMVESQTDQIKIIDFGLSKHLDTAVTLGVGTPDYMAPELLNAGPGRVAPGRYDARQVDVWALGVMLYLLVAGVYPFEDPKHPDNVAHTLQNVRLGRIAPLPGVVSASCADLIARMLHKNPRRRITLNGLKRHPWMMTHGDEALIPTEPEEPTDSNKTKRSRASSKGCATPRRSEELTRKASSLLKNSESSRGAGEPACSGGPTAPPAGSSKGIVKLFARLKVDRS